jgi:hypothetical protein
MGVWGTELYDNDSACDVRDGYLDFIQDGLANDEAYEKTLEMFHEYIGDDDEPVFWLALAETQWKVGRLRSDVRDKAFEWIEKKGHLDFWEEQNPRESKGWERTLQKLKEKLERPMPKEKRIPKVDRNPWNLHDVYAYRFHQEESKENGFFGKYMLLQKIGEHRHAVKNRLFMQIQVIDHVFDELPELDDINKYRILPLDSLRNIEYRTFRMNAYIYHDKQSEYPIKQLTFLGNLQGPSNKVFTRLSSETLFWIGIEYRLSLYHQVWQNKEYETVEEGVYNYIPE